MNQEELIKKIQEMFVDYGPKVLGAVVVWIIGVWIIKLVTKGITKLMERSKWDDSLVTFMGSLTTTALKMLLAISVLGMLGIEMTSFIAILGAAGLAVGLALSGTLQNFAGGVVILIFKPFKVGDYLKVDDHEGFVKEIQIFNTIIRTLDYKTIILPNGNLSTSTMTNLSTEKLIRIDWTFGIAYGDDVDKAREVILRLVTSNDKLAKDPAVMVALESLGDSSVNLTCRGWVTVADYWDLYFDLNEKVYKTFAKEGLNIPFPQMDLHIHKTE